jgi:hypothetical protein
MTTRSTASSATTGSSLLLATAVPAALIGQTRTAAASSVTASRLFKAILLPAFVQLSGEVQAIRNFIPISSIIFFFQTKLPNTTVSYCCNPSVVTSKVYIHNLFALKVAPTFITGYLHAFKTHFLTSKVPPPLPIPKEIDYS